MSRRIKGKKGMLVCEGIETEISGVPLNTEQVSQNVLGLVIL